MKSVFLSLRLLKNVKWSFEIMLAAAWENFHQMKVESVSRQIESMQRELIIAKEAPANTTFFSDDTISCHPRASLK